MLRYFKFVFSFATQLLQLFHNLVRVILIPIMERIVGRGVIKLKDLVIGVGMRGGVAGKAMKSSPLLGPFCGSEFWGFSMFQT